MDQYASVGIPTDSIGSGEFKDGRYRPCSEVGLSQFAFGWQINQARRHIAAPRVGTPTRDRN